MMPTDDVAGDGPVVYEVRATVPPPLRERYERYMREQHVPDVVSTGCFEHATFEGGGDGEYRVSYWARDRVTLDHYLATYTAGLRTEFLREMGDGVSLHRAEWHVLQRFERES